MKNKLLKFGNLYEEIRKEALIIIEKMKPKLQNITDAQIIQSFIEKRDFYWKHDLPNLTS